MDDAECDQGTTGFDQQATAANQATYLTNGGDTNVAQIQGTKPIPTFASENSGPDGTTVKCSKGR
jgi:hypothetical protein